VSEKLKFTLESPPSLDLVDHSFAAVNPVVIPEPVSALLLGSGLAGLGLLSSRRVTRR